MTARERFAWVLIAVVFVAAPFGTQWIARDAANDSVNLYMPGRVMQLQVRSGYIILPTCPTEMANVETGGLCKNPSEGTVMYRGTLEAIP